MTIRNDMKDRMARPENYNPEIAIDLDGTLAYYDGYRGPDHIGAPIPSMLAMVKKLIEEGRTVVIFTARADCAENINYVKEWLYRHGLSGLEVTNIKKKQFIEIYDDRAYRVKRNGGFDRDQANLEPVPEPAPNPLCEQVGGNHYKDMKIQPLEFCHANKLGSIESSIIKYTCRHGKKNGKEDLEKAIHLIKVLIDLEYN